ncbi:hypothetical protein LBMAG57_19820 [Verrucomicrobiota bacterium]|nr:hypothetical protein LBMAG57_19820 [Verrucomicrobiota bacterium]
MAAKLLSNCAEDKLLVACGEDKLLVNCGGVMKIRFTWTGAAGYWTWTGSSWVWTPPVGFDLFSEVTFLGTSLGWISNGLGPTAYLTWFVSETPFVGGYEDYTIRVDDALADGVWATSTVIYLEADWYFSAGSALTVTVTYNGVTQVKTISPSSITTIATFVAGPTSQIVTSVGTVTVLDNGTFTLA